MTSDTDPLPDASREDAAFLEALNASFEPPTLDGRERSAFDARLRARLDESSRGAAGALALLTAAGAGLALLAWNPFPAAQGDRGEPRSVVAAEADGSIGRRASWEQRLFYGDPTRLPEDGLDAESALPAEYAAIGSLLLDDAPLP